MKNVIIECKMHAVKKQLEERMAGNWRAFCE